MQLNVLQEAATFFNRALSRQFFFLYFKCKESLRHIAEDCHDNIGKHITYGRKDAERVKKRDEIIGEHRTDTDGNEVADHLYPAPEIGFLKDNVPGHQKAVWRRNHKCHDGRRNHCAYHGKWQVHILLMKQVVEGAIINGNIEQGPAAAAGEVAKGLRINPPREWQVEKINNTQYDMADSAQQGGQK